jgi:hypothetical protein
MIVLKAEVAVIRLPERKAEKNKLKELREEKGKRRDSWFR